MVTGLKIQSVTHDSIEDARTALRLYQCYMRLVKEDTVQETLVKLYEDGCLSLEGQLCHAAKLLWYNKADS
ncbi:hypothetical protein PR048_031142 [Dryococelus australis]|uniref:Exonuclease domain-containing protein n=1 Tax=Dryococelus australis TaxID=614101 RepID=A0ABQ9G786_9NEOP|nr:hypothetical protein PR048_031142 [Dryococelus australis]